MCECGSDCVIAVYNYKSRFTIYELDGLGGLHLITNYDLRIGQEFLC